MQNPLKQRYYYVRILDGEDQYLGGYQSVPGWYQLVQNGTGLVLASTAYTLYWPVQGWYRLVQGGTSRYKATVILYQLVPPQYRKNLDDPPRPDHVRNNFSLKWTRKCYLHLLEISFYYSLLCILPRWNGRHLLDSSAEQNNRGKCLFMYKHHSTKCSKSQNIHLVRANCQKFFLLQNVKTCLRT